MHAEEKSRWLSAFPAGLGGNDGYVLFHFGAFALRTVNFGFSMLGNALCQSEFLVAIPAFILVGWHILPPCFLIV
jgi:hypothetical protein